MIKEFMTGGDKVIAAKKIIENLEGRQKLSVSKQKELDRARKISRRHSFNLILGGLATGATLAASGTAIASRFLSAGENVPLDSDTILPETDFDLRDLYAIPARKAEVLRPEAFDTKYIRRLLDSLKTPAGLRVAETRQELFKNVGLIFSSEDKSMGSSIKICESGYYLTAAHVILSNSEDVKINPKTQIYHPSTGVLVEAKSAIVDPDSDLAILWAPTGKKRERTHGIQIKDEPLTQGEKLWLLGVMIFEQYEPAKFALGIPHGTVDTTISSDRLFTREGHLFTLVEHMKPFGGSSGGPVIDSKGRIVAIESGFFINRQNDDDPIENERRNYTHAMVSPTSNVSRVFDSKVYSVSK